jgi:rhodanese-related sulfurtransferase
MKLTQNEILAGSAIVLSIFALIAGSPFSSKKSYINPEQFADSLISKKQNLTIVDLRDKKDYDDYHIPSAVNGNATDIDPSTFDKNNMIVFYSGRDNISKAIQYEFEKRGFKNAYFLNGGIDDWTNKILFPDLSKNSSEAEKKNFEKIERRSMYFGGQPEREDENSVKKVYRREGC